MVRRNKITVVGAGNVGATAAHWIVEKNYKFGRYQKFCATI